jgi:hypothetical protein
MFIDDGEVRIIPPVPTFITEIFTFPKEPVVTALIVPFMPFVLGTAGLILNAVLLFSESEIEPAFPTPEGLSMFNDPLITSTPGCPAVLTT